MPRGVAASAAHALVCLVAAMAWGLVPVASAQTPGAPNVPPGWTCEPGACTPRREGRTSPVVRRKTWVAAKNRRADAFGLASPRQAWADSYLAWHAQHDQWVCHCKGVCDHGVCNFRVDTQSSAGVQEVGQICADIETAYGPAPSGAPTIYFNSINCGNVPLTKHIVDPFGIPDEVWCPGRVDEPNWCGHVGLGWDLSFYEGWTQAPWGPTYAPADGPDQAVWNPDTWLRLLGLLFSAPAERRTTRYAGCIPAAAADSLFPVAVRRRAGRYSWSIDDGGMTPDLCRQLCVVQAVEDEAVPAYKFFALQGDDCRCSAVKRLPKGITAPPGAACDIPCEGDAGEACGDHFSAYRIRRVPAKYFKGA